MRALRAGSWNSIRINGDLVSVAMAKWYDNIGKFTAGAPGPDRVWNQDKPYECTACCKP